MILANLGHSFHYIRHRPIVPAPFPWRELPFFANPLLGVSIQALVPAAQDSASRFDVTGRGHFNFDNDEPLNVLPDVINRVIGGRVVAARWPFMLGVNDGSNE